MPDPTREATITLVIEADVMTSWGWTQILNRRDPADA